MSKLYVFGIGGTGSRVLRALTMLLASGAECKADAIVPIIIDPDATAADMTRTVELMKRYGEIRSKLKFDTATKNKFFKTGIEDVYHNNFRLPLRNTEDVRFAEYMDLSGMTQPNQALANMLFSQKNLASDMVVGFKGNPNVGSVVLNQFDDSPEFLNFANEFTDKDKIFIISSIFGGTGASGFPLLLKTLRTNQDLPNKNYVNNAHIGAITVLPYFAVKTDEGSQIDSATFVSKAKSALAYYERSISKNNAIDNLYYIADDARTAYENSEGGIDQKNNAHFVELAAALAIIDFAGADKPAVTVHKEFGIEENVNEIIFDNLGRVTKQQLRKALTQFLLFSKYKKEVATDDSLKQPFAKDRAFDATFFGSDFIRTLENLQKEYIVWLQEMTTQTRAFTPFHLHENADKVFELVKGVEPKRVMSLDSNYDLCHSRLNKQSKEEGVKEQQFVELFYKATEILIDEKLNIK
ncbi:MAG: hypothetical protein LBN27_13455 [Prevotellaceae bacterium]|jgi:hypothetical protein|nr:hypothetical protein [Prevotellaceae bacterium]